MSRDKFDVAKWSNEQQSRYGSARDSRFRRRRQTAPMGSGGDYHLQGNDFLRIMEYARALDRDDSIIGSVLDRAELNTVQNGFLLDFDTGDKTLDQDLLGDHIEWATSPERCDTSGELAFAELESMAFRFSKVDGDLWALLTDDDQIQPWEAHRIRTPSGSVRGDRSIINGVELNEARERLQVWITQEDVSPWITNVDKFETRPIRDGLGMRRVLQVYADTKRYTLTRGVSCFQKLYDLAGMRDDTEFAALLKQQLQNALVFTEEMKPGDNGVSAPFGEQETEVRPDGTVETVEGIGPGTIVRGKNGRSLKPFMNTAPGPEFVGHIRHILTLMGVNLGMPLVLVLMDASETNFSGWRGAFDQAKLGFRRNQDRLLKRWHNPILAWRLRYRRMNDSSIDRAMTRIVEKARAAGKQWYKWHLPSWPYVSPLEDSQASLIAVANYQEAPSTNMARSGLDYDREMQRGIEDRGMAIELAIEEAQRLNEKYKALDPGVQWTDLYTPPAPKHVQFSISENRDAQSSAAGQRANQKQGA